MKSNYLSRFFSKNAAKVAVPLSALAPALANANTLAAGGTISTTTNGADVGASSFDQFANTVLTWSQGGLGIGLAITAILIGAGIAVMKNSPLPVLAGIVLAAFLHWGPVIIVTLLTGSTLS